MSDLVKQFDSLNKQFASTFFDYMLDYENFSKYYSLLLNNLPEDQQKLLISLFARIMYMHHAQFYLNVDFTDEEIAATEEIEKNFTGKIAAINDYFQYGNYKLPINLFEASLFYYQLGINNIKNKSKLVNTDFLDVGAFIGDSAIVLNSLNPQKIYAFEPVDDFHIIINETIRVNGLEDKIIPIKSGLGSYQHADKIAVNGASSSKFLLEHEDLKKQDIVVDTIDNFVEKNNLNVGLIKIDVEGLELDVLKGAEKTIRKFKPVILAAIYHNGQEFFELKPRIEELDLGYKFHFNKYNPSDFLNEINVICEVY